MNNHQAPIQDARVLGWPKMLILGLQHMFAMFGATVLVPMLVSNSYGLPLSIQTTRPCPSRPPCFLPVSAPCFSTCVPS